MQLKKNTFWFLPHTCEFMVGGGTTDPYLQRSLQKEKDTGSQRYKDRKKACSFLANSDSWQHSVCGCFDCILDFKKFPWIIWCLIFLYFLFFSLHAFNFF